MQSALKLTDQERLCFMQALNAVVRRDADPGEIWLALLGVLGRLFDVSATDYDFKAGAPVIAEKLNQIGNPRARLYFLRIIHDAHQREMESFFFQGQKDACKTRFLPFYNKLAADIRRD